MFTELKWEVIDNGRKRQLTEDYTYENSKYKITVKAGFITDGASIPKAFWTVLSSPFSGPLVYGAVIHDGLYAAMKLPRKVCDGLLYEMGSEMGYNKIKDKLVYRVVRLFGGSRWKKDTEAEMHLVRIETKGK